MSEEAPAVKGSQEPPSPPALADLLSRQRRVVDMLITMHSRLRDRAATRAKALTVGILCASVIGTAFAFAGGDVKVELLGLRAARATWLGWLAVVIFVLTLVDLVLDQRGVARSHQDAVRLLSDLGAEYRRLDPAVGEDEKERLDAKYQDVMRQIPPVPERSFNRLKAAHLRKVEVSRLLSDHPGLSERAARKAVRDRLPKGGRAS